MTYLAVEGLKTRSPARWEWLALRRVVRLRRERNTGSAATLLALASEDGVRPRPDDGGRQLPSETTIEDYWLVKPGDLVFNPMWAIGRGVAVSEIEGAVSTAYRVYEPRHLIHPRFLHYFMRSDPVVAQYGLVVRGLTTFDRSVGRDDLEGMPVPVPPVSEQRAIADFLDAETARIDALIAKKRRLIELLDERYRSVIDEVTAAGRPMRVRHVTSLITSGPRGWAEQVGEVGQPFIRSANLRRESVDLRRENILRVDAAPTAEASRSQVRAGDAVVGITGANTGWVGTVTPSDAPAYVSQHVAILRPAGVDPTWLAFSVFSKRSQESLLAGQYGGTKQQLGLADLADLVVTVPPLDEQRRLVAVVEQVGEACRTAGARLQYQVDLLVERRQAVITTAVSGEIVVPGVDA